MGPGVSCFQGFPVSFFSPRHRIAYAEIAWIDLIKICDTANFRQLLQYFEAFPSPLSQANPATGQRPPFDAADAIPRLVRRLRPYHLAKGELVMILNLRPTNVPTLNAVLEDMEDRFTPEQQEDIVAGVAEVLGGFEAQDGEGDGDAMQTTE